MTCVVCEDTSPAAENCPACKGAGQFPISGCPKKMLSRDIFELCRLASFMDDGLPPVAGGALDQTAAFLTGYGFLKAEDAGWTARAMRKT